MRPHPCTGIPHVRPWQPVTWPPTWASEIENAQAETESQQQAGHTRIQVRGELDLDTIHVLAQALTAAERAVVVDLGRVTFADTALVHTLLRAHPHHELTLTGSLTPQVRRLLDVTGTLHRFTFSPVA
ncbi:STAS domain-containing protein [Streptomyces erythrochromogenes]|uniref:STAS domain-containing protein n=1 Tax=Streptomyces erythrochromogenes TaxID=285574 RepID=UPI0036924DA1